MKLTIPTQPNLKGMALIRATLARVHGKSENISAGEIAANVYGENVARIVKGAQAAGVYANIGDSEKAVAEFFDAVREASVLGRMRARRVGMRTKTMFATTPIEATWVRPGHSMPVGRTIWDPSSLEPLYVGALTVVTKDSIEAALGGDPLAEQGIRRDMVRAVAHAVDEALLDPTNGGTAGVEPASITNGATSSMAGGDPLGDLKDLIANFDGDLTTSTFIMQPGIAAALAGKDFPGLGVLGGDIWGIPAVTSRKAPAATIILADGEGLALAEGEINIDFTTQGSIEMADDPTNQGDSPVSESTIVSMWQTNCVAFKSVLAVNWKNVRTGNVSMLTNIAYRPFVT